MYDGPLVGERVKLSVGAVFPKQKSVSNYQQNILEKDPLFSIYSTNKKSVSIDSLKIPKKELTMSMRKLIRNTHNMLELQIKTVSNWTIGWGCWL